MTSDQETFKRLVASRDAVAKPVEVQGMKLVANALSVAGLTEVQQPHVDFSTRKDQATKAERAAVQAESNVALLRHVLAWPDGSSPFEGMSDSEVMAMPFPLWLELLDVAQEHSGMANADLDALVKNSEATDGDGSPSV